MEVWTTTLANKRTTLHNDNMAVMRIRTKTTSRNSKIVALVRKLIIRCILCNLQFRAVHIPGYRSVQGDLLSRLQIETLHQHMGQQATCAITGRHPAMQLVSGLERLLTKSVARASYSPFRSVHRRVLTACGSPVSSTTHRISSAWVTYTRAIAALDKFLRQFDIAARLPVAPITVTVALFVSPMQNQKYAASTIETYGSEIGYIHKLHGLPHPTDDFSVRKASMGANKNGMKPDIKTSKYGSITALAN